MCTSSGSHNAGCAAGRHRAASKRSSSIQDGQRFPDAFESRLVINQMELTRRGSDNDPVSATSASRSLLPRPVPRDARLPYASSVARARRCIILLVVWVASAAYVGVHLDRGWIPWDEGTLAHSAERVLQGEMPHRDFDDVYTGGLARFDALAFEVLGTRLSSLRIPLFAIFLLWVPAVYYIATRFAKPLVAGLVTLLCVVWSIPTYPAAMPSWYNLFLATFGMAALIRFTETRQRRWLVAAGAAGGLSVVVKIVGIYYVAAVLLFFAFDEHQMARSTTGPTRSGRGFALIMASGSGLFVLALLQFVVRAVPSASSLLHFVLPGALLVSVLTVVEWRDPGYGSLLARLRGLLARVWPFALGAAVPVLVFAAPYVASNSVGVLIRGVFIEPTKRFHFAAAAPASLNTVVAALPWLLVLMPPRRRVDSRRWADRAMVAAIVVMLSVAAVLATRGGRPFIAVWIVVCYIVPCVVLAGCIVLVSQDQTGGGVRRVQLWLLLCMTALCSLVQVPFAGALYIFYFVPIAILAVLAIVATRSAGPGPLAGVGLCFFLAYGVTAVNPGHIRLLDGALRGRDTQPTVPLRIPRTGLTSTPIYAARYERVVALLHAHSGAGGFTYAAPDCPELYFLAELRNPTRTLFDFQDDPQGHDDRVIRSVDARHVTAIVINTHPMFSAPIDAALAAALRARFPDSAVVDSFVVRWGPGR